jgi:hypothetical protein
MRFRRAVAPVLAATLLVAPFAGNRAKATRAVRQGLVDLNIKVNAFYTLTL